MKGIYIVANAKSEELCANLVYSIRNSGCKLPIRLIPFGGNPVKSESILDQVEVVSVELFSSAGQEFVEQLSSVLTDCPRGFLKRFLAWFGDWDEFIYTDNDVVALTNWELLFNYLPGNDLVHADEEYTTKGRFNFCQPERIEQIFGKGALLSAVTAGHFVARRDSKMVQDMRQAIKWFKQNPNIPKRHDQALLNVAALIGGWKMVNLCKPPHHWLSSWWGDYKNPLALIHAIQAEPVRLISHLHYSGGVPIVTDPAADFLTANLGARQRALRLIRLGLFQLTGGSWFVRRSHRVRQGLSRRLKEHFKKS